MSKPTDGTKTIVQWRVEVHGYRSMLWHCLRMIREYSGKMDQNGLELEGPITWTEWAIVRCLEGKDW